MFAAERKRMPRPQNSGDEQNVQAAGQPRDVMMNSNWVVGSTPTVAGSADGWGSVSRSRMTGLSAVSEKPDPRGPRTGVL